MRGRGRRQDHAFQIWPRRCETSALCQEWIYNTANFPSQISFVLPAVWVMTVSNTVVQVLGDCCLTTLLVTASSHKKVQIRKLELRSHVRRLPSSVPALPPEEESRVKEHLSWWKYTIAVAGSPVSGMCKYTFYMLSCCSNPGSTSLGVKSGPKFNICTKWWNLA